MADSKPQQQQQPKEAKKPAKKFNLADYPVPSYAQHRINVWDEVKKKREEEAKCMYLLKRLSDRISCFEPCADPFGFFV
jgi:hypothetical protein